MAMNSILSRPAEENKPPPTLVPGDYLCRVMSHKQDETTRSKAGNDQVFFTINIEAPLELTGEENPEVTYPVEMTLRYVLTEKAAYRLADFVGIDCGITLEGSTLGAELPNTTGCQFRGSIIQRPRDDNPERFYMEMKKTAPLE